MYAMHGPHSGADVEKLRASGVVKLKGDDLFALWIKTACCNLSSKQLKGVADIAEKHARGILLFSSRQIPIIPFVQLKDVPEAKEDLEKLYLELDRCGPTVRNVNVCYDDKICPHAITNSLSLGEKLDNFFHVPMFHKIKIGVAGCEKNCIIGRVLNDVCFVGMSADGEPKYDAYVGGRLGVNPFVGVKMADSLPENGCVKFVQNYFDLIQSDGKKGERGADIIKRLGEEEVKKKLNKDVTKGMAIKPIECKTMQSEKQLDKIILKIRAVCGEVTSKQARQIAGIAEKYGKGFVHFTIRGDPEIPCINKKDVAKIKKELKEAGLDVLDKGIDNIQSCFGSYCTESIVDAQSLLKKIDALTIEMGVNNRDIKISGSGCPNSCGIAHLNDLGFHGEVEPEVDASACTGCGLCASVCKRHAIEVKNKLAVIDNGQCKRCGQCISVCPLDAMNEKRKGFAVLVGGKEGKDTRLGEIVAEFVSEEEALAITRKCLALLKERNTSAAAIIDEVGIETFRKMLV